MPETVPSISEARAIPGVTQSTSAVRSDGDLNAAESAIPSRNESTSMGLHYLNAAATGNGPSCSCWHI